MTERRESEIVALLRDLSLAPGPPAHEAGVREVILDALQDVGGLEISHDRLGSLIVEKPGSRPAPRVALDAHLDEVGFMIESIRDDGMLSFVALGG